MTARTPKSDDVALILGRRHDNGADCWATPDGRWGKGSPFSTFDCILSLTELGVKPSHPALKGAAGVLWSAWQEDGRIRPAPKGTVYPCHTANAARALCRLGYAKDKRMKVTLEHLLSVLHTDGGWRCNRARLGASEAADASNPGVTLSALDAFRFTPALNKDRRLDRAVETLLDHWEIKRPWGPCSFGIGTLFRQMEFPFLRYNLFSYVFVLSFFKRAHKDRRFREALDLLGSKVVDGELVVENPNRGLARLEFCKKGFVSAQATGRYREILRRVGG